MEFYSYYLHFNIDIHKYLTLNELIFSFLPMTLPIIIITLIGFLIISSKRFVSIVESLRMKIIPYQAFAGVKLLKQNGRNDKFRSNFFMYFAAFQVVLFFLLYAVLIFLVLNNLFWDICPKIRLNYISLIIWIVLIIPLLLINANIKNRLDTINNITSFDLRVFLLTLYIISASSLINFNKVKNIYAGRNIDYVTFEIGDSIIKSDNCLIYIGITEQYLFLHELGKSKNIIYRRDKIDVTNFSK